MAKGKNPTVKVGGIVEAREVVAKRLRLEASFIDEDYGDLLCTYNRIWNATDGRDPRLPLIDKDLRDMRKTWRAKLDMATRLLGERR